MTTNIENFGKHRVLEPARALPQNALKLNSIPKIIDESEMLIEVERLLLDATSFYEIKNSSEYNENLMSKRILEIVQERGKMHNPKTHSGGVLQGIVKEVGAKFSDQSLRPGDKVISVASLSTIPMNLESILSYDKEQILVKGQAIAFSSTKIFKIPHNIKPSVALGAVDISSLVPQLNRTTEDLLQNRDESKTLRVLMLGLGKAGIAGLLTLKEIKKSHPTKKIQVIGLDIDDERITYLKEKGFLDFGEVVDATNPVEMFSVVARATNNEMCDLLVNAVNVPSTESPTLLCAKNKAHVMWFSMATQFDKAALATDSLGMDIIQIIGNGIANNQVEDTLDLFLKYPEIKKKFL